MRRIDYIVVHCSATKGDVSAKTIDSWHRERGWSGIGYHYVVRENGTIEEGRKLETAGAHVKGFNANSIGICMAGGLNDHGQASNNFSSYQFTSLRSLINALKAAFPDSILEGHRDFPGVNKECPCFDVKEWYSHN